MVELILVTLLLVIGFFEAMTHALWQRAVRGTRVRYVAKGRAWAVAIVAVCYSTFYFVYRLTAVESVGEEVWVRIILPLIILTDIYHLVVLYKDKDDDPFRDAYKKAKKKLSSFSTWRPPRTASSPIQ